MSRKCKDFAHLPDDDPHYADFNCMTTGKEPCDECVQFVELPRLKEEVSSLTAVLADEREAHGKTVRRMEQCSADAAEMRTKWQDAESRALAAEKSLAERDAERDAADALESKLAEVTKSRDEERIEAWGYEIEVGDLKAKLSAQAKAIEAAREAFHLEDEKVTKARDFILNMKCSCKGEGIGTPGGCDRCRALDYLSTFAWDFNAALVPAPAVTEKGEGA